MALGRPLGIVMVLVTCTACSPYVYQTEIKTFTDGMKAVSDADAQGAANLAAARSAADHRAWTARTDDDITTAGCAVGLSGCRLTDATPTDFERELLTVRAEVDAERAKVVPTLKALNSYGRSLGAVTNAADSASLAAAQGDLNAALERLVTTAGGAEAAPKVGVVASLFSGILRSVLEQQRYDTLKDGTAEAQGYLEILKKQLAANLTVLHVSLQNELALQIRSAETSLEAAKSRKVYAERLAILADLADRLAALQRADPAKLVTKMVDAHTGLRDALQTGKGQTVAVLQNIREFAELAGTFATAFKA
ncbi:MAG: hypothetical protein AAFO51_00570 [Pseudomonadota bacterium]